jgi:hypothetical protein
MRITAMSIMSGGASRFTLVAVTLKEYLDAKKTGGPKWATMNIYLSGFTNGLSFANIYNTEAHVPPLYCPPVTLRLNDENIFDIVTATVKREALKVGDEGWIEGMLLRGMQFTFPCK